MGGIWCMGLRLSPRVEEGSTEVSVADVFSAEGVITSRGVAVDHVSTQSSLPPCHNYSYIYM